MLDWNLINESKVVRTPGPLFRDRASCLPTPTTTTDTTPIIVPYPFKGLPDRHRGLQ
jgi:hypothetical protein